MIVASLLLILVAVTLLVLGLTGGSSNILISSIVASLLAAVALVVGARQSGAARRAAAGTTPEAAAPEFAAEAASPERGIDDFPPAGATFAAESAHSDLSDDRGDLSDRRETVQFESAAYDDYDELEPEPVQEPDYDYEREAFEAGRRDTAAAMAAAAGRREETPPVPEAGPDRDLAAETISAARSEDPDEYAWRRPEPVHAEPVHADPVHAEPVHAEATVADEAADLDAGLEDADEDDPADEPLPQKVSPADAVRVARLDSEVLVVDGRPRYHVPDCSHLVGKLTEPIPVNEAVELGFSPCGLCRPVDRLVGAAARH